MNEYQDSWPQDAIDEIEELTKMAEAARESRNRWLGVARIQYAKAERMESEVERLRAKRAAVVAKVRDICEEWGDTDWPDDLNLVDVLEKHLEKHLWAYAKDSDATHVEAQKRIEDLEKALEPFASLETCPELSPIHYVNRNIRVKDICRARDALDKKVGEDEWTQFENARRKSLVLNKDENAQKASHKDMAKRVFRGDPISLGTVLEAIAEVAPQSLPANACRCARCEAKRNPGKRQYDDEHNTWVIFEDGAFSVIAVEGEDSPLEEDECGED